MRRLSVRGWRLHPAPQLPWEMASKLPPTLLHKSSPRSCPGKMDKHLLLFFTISVFVCSSKNKKLNRCRQKVHKVGMSYFTCFEKQVWDLIENTQMFEKVCRKKGMLKNKYWKLNSTSYLLRMCDCIITICSPARPPPVLDLRTIMDMEANSLQTLGATPKSPGRYGRSASFTSKLLFYTNQLD